MSAAEKGSKVKVHYKGSFEDGEIFDTSEGQDPLEFTLGEQMVIQGFDDAVTGMKVGEKKTVTIAPTEGYGSRNDQLIGQVERDRMPEGMDPEVGMTLTLNTPQGPFPVRVVEVADDMVTLDGNHPLADKTLVFDLELVEIAEA